jgi:hypothetical protein
MMVSLPIKLIRAVTDFLQNQNDDCSIFVVVRLWRRSSSNRLRPGLACRRRRIKYGTTGRAQPESRASKASFYTIGVGDELTAQAKRVRRAGFALLFGPLCKCRQLPASDQRDRCDQISKFP